MFVYEGNGVRKGLSDETDVFMTEVLQIMGKGGGAACSITVRVHMGYYHHLLSPLYIRGKDL